MKAIVYTEYGPPDVLHLEEVAKPVPAENQALVKIYAASVNTLDLTMTGPLMARVVTGALRKPKDQRIGVDLAGEVEAVGSALTQFKPGDEVFGRGTGAFAEYACVPEDALVLKPANATFEAAAAVPVAALTALQGLRDHGHIQSGQKVLINGASGGVGTFAVQIAKSFGAEVTAVCSSRNVDMVRSIGADRVVDYTQEDFAQNGQRYDLILAVSGYLPILAYRRLLTPNGIYVMVGGSHDHVMKAIFQALLLGSVLSKTGPQKMGFFLAKVNQEDLVCLKALLEAGKIVPVIDRRYPLSETAEAVRYLQEGHARGKVIITVAQ